MSHQPLICMQLGLRPRNLGSDLNETVLRLRSKRTAKTDRSLAVLARVDSSYAIEFLKRLSSRGFKPSTLCVEYTSFTQRVKKARFLAARIGWLDAARYNARFWLPLLQRKISLNHWKPLPVFDHLADRVVTCQNINDPSVANALSDPNITKVVLAQPGIIRERILSLGRWTVNAHPGSLPNFRGVDVIRWALLNRQPIQVTLHLVDSGIDTGPVLQRVTIPVLAGDTIQSVIDRTISTSLDILVDAALSGPAGYGKPVPQDKNKGKQYFLMPFGLVRKLEEEWPDVIKSYEQSAKSHRPKGTHRNPAWSP